jgi:hypothetical protein
LRKIIRTLLLLLLFAALFPFVYPWKDGKPLLSWSDLKMPALPSFDLPQMPDISLPGNDEPRPPHQPVRVYRWQGEDGGIQFSNEPPPAGVAYTVVEVNPDANLIQAPTAAAANTTRTPEAPKAAPPSSPIPSPLTVSPGQALQLIEDARNVQKLSDERLRQQDALTQ